jgi:cation:H+ antiporter
MESTGPLAPWLFLGVFIAASFVMIWRLECMAADGLDGTVLGTVVMPYLTGLGNLIFAFVLGRQGGKPSDVLTNCLVNNVSNMTFVLGVPAIIWNMNILPSRKNGGKTGKSKSKTKTKSKKGGDQTNEVNRLSLLLTLLAVLFFTGTTWALGSSGSIGFSDGLVLVGIFLFWQCFHVFDVLKSNVRQNKSLSWMLPVDLAILAVCGYATYVSTDWLVNWISHIHTGFISAKYMGLLSGWLMVLPNATLAVYYGITGRPEVVYTSQVGDSHICIPLCIGVFALYRRIPTPGFFSASVFILLAATVLHFVCIGVLGRLPRTVGWVLVAAYGYFLYLVYNGLAG